MEENERIYDLDFDWNGNYEEKEEITAHAESVGDGLIMSLDCRGCVDIDYIAAVCGRTAEQVISELGSSGAIYRNPQNWDGNSTSGWETSDEYLSGNISAKLKAAKEAEEIYPGQFTDNIEALSALVEPDLDASDIYVSLGSPWVPTSVIDNFILHLVGEDPVNGVYRGKLGVFLKGGFCVRHDDVTGLWEIPHKNRLDYAAHRKYTNIIYNVYGTNRIPMLQLLEACLNMRTCTVTDEKRMPDGTVKRVVNSDETAKLLERQERMTEEFRNWVWADPERKALLRSAYCSRYCNIRRRVYNGSFLSFPDMSADIKLYPYQKDAVARILFSKNTLLAHDVGAGKTYELTAAVMELKRTHRSEKNMIVVPNSIIGQWKTTFLQMYPQARLLVVDSRNFGPKHRENTLKRIINEDFDAIIIAYSCFDMLKPSKQWYQDYYSSMLNRLENTRDTFYSDAKVEIKKRTVMRKLEAVNNSVKDNNDGLNFDDLGVNTLVVDEAHNYKNLTVESGITNVMGFGSKSAKAECMLHKVRCVQQQNDGGRIVMATGTPITNSVTDVFVMQKYLQNEELSLLGIANFDSWAGMFADKTTSFEIDVDTSGYHLVTRFARFGNVPELSAILSLIADFHRAEAEKGLPEFDGYTLSQGKGSQRFIEYLKDISERADAVRSRKIDRKEDNLLKITIDGRKAALDMRLIDPSIPDYPESKVDRCADNIIEVYRNTRDFRGTQLVFCDSSTPKPGFNMYSELKRLLVARGIPADEILFIHDVEDRDREKLFKSVRDGKVAVLIGSTAKLGTGVNVQTRCAAIHHLDLPWKPSDMVQREGRILRPGNECKSVKIFRYITNGSFDAFSWQLLEGKQRFISQLLSGCMQEREGSDIDNAALSYAEVKALAVGNPLMKKRVETANELDRFRILQRGYIEDRRRKQQELAHLPERISNQKLAVDNCRLDLEETACFRNAADAMSEDEKKELCRKVWKAAGSCVNRETDTPVCSFGGFDVIVPAHMFPRTQRQKTGDNTDSLTFRLIPYICLCRNGRYYIDIETEKGVISRLSHFVKPYNTAKHGTDTAEQSEEDGAHSGLERTLERFSDALLEYKTREAVLTDELAHEGGYAAAIDRTAQLLDEIDEKLEVKAS